MATNGSRRLRSTSQNMNDRRRRHSFELLEPRRMLDTTLKAVFQYPTVDQSHAGTYAPVRDASVQVEDVATGTPVILAHLVPLSNPPQYSTAPVYTGNDGSITFDTNGITPNSKVVFVVSTDSDPNQKVGEYKVVNPNNNGSVYAFNVVPTGAAIVPDGTVQLPPQQITFADNANVAALSVFDGLTIGALYGDTLINQAAGGNFVGVTAQYPASGHIRTRPNATNGKLTSATIYVPQSSGYDYEEVAHEFGHYMAAAAGFFNYLPPTHHAWDESMIGAETEAGGKLDRAQGLQGAMNEGFADYFAVAAAAAQANGSLNLYGVGTGTTASMYFAMEFTGWNGAYPDVGEAEAHSLTDPDEPGEGEGYESTVARVMYGLAFGGYSVPEGAAVYQLSAPTSVWSILASAQPPQSLTALLKAAVKQQPPVSPQQWAGLGQLQQDNNVSAAAAVNAKTPLTATGAPPVFVATLPTEANGILAQNAAEPLFFDSSFTPIPVPGLEDSEPGDDSQPGVGFLGAMSQT
ncbi:MAG TPA: hypothetical protein VGG11_08060, partial [Xanthobacteraceae bacterium]